MTRANCTHDLRTQGQLRFQTVDFYPQVPARSPLCHQSVRGERFFQWDQVFCCIQNCPGPARFGGSCLQHLEAGKTVRVVYGVIYPWDFARRQCLHWNICAGWMHKVEGKKESVAWLLQNSNRHEAMSCINYMKGQISLGEPHSIEGHHRPALSRLARVPRPASSESAKQQWVCKKMRGHKIWKAHQVERPKTAQKGPPLSQLCLVKSQAHSGLTVECLDGILLGNLVSEQTFASNWCLRQWAWLHQALHPKSGSLHPPR